MTFLKKVEIFVPLMDAEIHNIEDVINELCSLSGTLQIRFDNNFFAPLYIERIKKSNPELKRAFKKRRSIDYTQFFLKFSANYTSNEIRGNFWSFDYFMENYVRHLLIYSNIAIPGGFDTREGVIFTKTYKGKGLKNEIEVKSEPFIMLANSLWDSVTISQKYKWPKIQKLPIIEILNFLNSHWNAFENLSSNRLQRALNAFSYLFHDTLLGTSHIDLFYSLIGIEALFVDGHDNVQKQVDKKSQILLGARGEFKKVFNELYDFRSRYIHGQLNFANRYFVNDIGDEVGNHQMKTYENASFAMALLVASIQKQILLKKSDLEFDLILKE